MKRHLCVGMLLGIVSLGLPAYGAFEEFTVSFAPEGAGGRTGTGGGTLTFDDVANTLTFNNIPWSGLSSDSTLCHIHGPAAAFPATAGVLYTLHGTYTTVGAGIRSGTISGTLPLVAGTGGFTLTDQINQLEGGLWYINIHSGTFGGGEIRGQILIPEPSTWALLALGAGAIAFRLRRRIAA